MILAEAALAVVAYGVVGLMLTILAWPLLRDLSRGLTSSERSDGDDGPPYPRRQLSTARKTSERSTDPEPTMTDSFQTDSTGSVTYTDVKPSEPSDEPHLPVFVNGDPHEIPRKVYAPGPFIRQFGYTPEDHVLHRAPEREAIQGADTRVEGYIVPRKGASFAIVPEVDEDAV
jgi:hypothetical protein